MFKPEENEIPYSAITCGHRIYLDTVTMTFNVYDLSTGENLLNTMNADKAERYLDDLQTFKTY